MKTLLLGISGSIAAYKAPELIRLLKKKNYKVIPVVTNSALKFVSKLVLENLSGEKCYTDDDMITADSYHLSLARQSDAFVIAPASANTLAKCLHGVADTLVTNLFLTFQGPVLMAPAMHSEMYEHASTKKNLNRIKKLASIIGPSVGELACNDFGIGRMVQPNCISDAVDFLFFKKLNLNGKKIIITLGGTEEEIDSVRVISNKSTGKLGKTIAMLSLLSGAQVTLISTVDIEDCGYASVINVKTSDEMSDMVEKHFKDCDYLIKAAAVSDFKVVGDNGKIKRHKQLNLNLTATNDILQTVAKKKTKQKVIGFCLAEQENLKKVAIEKCKSKHCDFIIANPLDSFGKNERTILICDKEQVLSEYKEISLHETAFQILSLISV